MLATVLIAVLVVLAFSPLVQTWVAEMALTRSPAIQGSVDSVMARFGRVEIGELQAKVGGATLKVPALAAELPIVTALWQRRLLVRRLVAKGWTLDLSGRPAAGGAPGPGGAVAKPAATGQSPALTAQSLAGMIRGALSRWALPFDLSLDGIDLEGDVLVAAPPRPDPVRIHVVAKGGGMASGHSGDFAIDVMTQVYDAEAGLVTLAGHGHFFVAMGSPRTFRRLEAKAEISAEGGPFPNPVTLPAEAAVELGPSGETYSLDVRRGERHLAAMEARFLADSNRMAGTWKLDVQDTDIAAFLPGRPLPRIAAVGSGEFDADAAFTAVHARGRLRGAVPQWEAMAPLLQRFGAETLEASFDVVQSGRALRVASLSVSLAGHGPTAVVDALQPFEIDETTGEPKPADPAKDWMNISVHGFPMDRLPSLMEGLAWSGGDAAGEFALRAGGGRFDLRSRSPVSATGVAVTHAGRTVGRRLDLAVSLHASYGPQGWQVQAAPLKIASGGGDLAELEIGASLPAERGKPIAIHGAGKADLQAPALKDALPDLGGFGGRSASGDFSATVGAATEFDGKLALVGRDEHRTLTAGVHATVEAGGRISFQAPLKIAFGPSVSEVSIDGTLLREGAATQTYLKVTGKEAVLEHLRLLAGAAARAGGWPPAATAGPAAATARDSVPFWGSSAGRILFDFDRLSAAGYVLDHVGGGLQVDQRSVHLEGGHGAVAAHRIANVEGSLSFDAAAELPYRLNATASLEPVEVASLFSAAKGGGDPLIEGRFSIAGTLTGTGNNLADVVSRMEERIELASTAGIVRVFKSDVDEAAPPEKDSAVGDALGRMGSAVGKFFGVDAGSGRRTVSPTLQAVLDVINETSEIGFDECKLTALRGADQTIRLLDIVMVAGDERVTGSGQIGYVPGRALRAQPLHADLQFGARGRVAKLMEAAGLLSAQKDAGGYTLLSEPLVFGGTLENMDRSAWHRLLVKAATRQPDVPKKSPEARH